MDKHGKVIKLKIGVFHCIFTWNPFLRERVMKIGRGDIWRLSLFMFTQSHEKCYIFRNVLHYVPFCTAWCTYDVLGNWEYMKVKNWLRWFVNVRYKFIQFVVFPLCDLNARLMFFFSEKMNADLSDHPDIHSITGFIKFFLRQLPDPLIPQDVFDEFTKDQSNIGLCLITLLS